MQFMDQWGCQAKQPHDLSVQTGVQELTSTIMYTLEHTCVHVYRTHVHMYVRTHVHMYVQEYTYKYYSACQLVSSCLNSITIHYLQMTLLYRDRDNF